ncbi:unnamed protein product [Brachionus calyciflorus]|uniref:Uncharacterized protein n=1 Tax=Brachionus calyciflorus TaxID=104777 RepID=A0A814PVX5_9BILA|nr:unnamed protein product [Brachionus calyciflorus]
MSDNEHDDGNHENSEPDARDDQIAKITMELKNKEETIKSLEKAFAHLSEKRVAFKLESAFRENLSDSDNEVEAKKQRDFNKKFYQLVEPSFNDTNFPTSSQIVSNNDSVMESKSDLTTNNNSIEKENSSKLTPNNSLETGNNFDNNP